MNDIPYYRLTYFYSANAKITATGSSIHQTSYNQASNLHKAPKKKLRESAPPANLIPHHDGISDNSKFIKTLSQPSRNVRPKLKWGTQNRQFNTVYTTDKFIEVSKNKTE